MKQYCAALVWVCSRRSEYAFPTLPQVQDAARATFGQQRMGYYPRRYSDYIPQELYQEKINAHFQKSKPPLGNAEDLDALGIPREHTVTSPGFGPKSKPPQEPETKPSPAGLETPEPKSEDGKRS